MKKAKHLQLSTSCTLHLVDTIVKPILLYGSEIFCFDNTTSLEKFYLQTLKRILYVRKSTPSYMVYGETGRKPLSYDIRQRATCFWTKVTNGKQDTLANKLKNILTNIHNKNNYTSPYITYIQRSLDDLGLTYLFNIDTNHSTKQNVSLIKQRSSDQYTQIWNDDVNKSSKSHFYKMIKSDPCFEEYLDIMPFKQRLTLTKYRLSNHNLPIEKGRWVKIEREQRLCPTCIIPTIGDEVHYLYECPKFNDERQKHMKKYFYKRPNVLKTNELFNSQNRQTLSKLSQLLYKINSYFL